MNGQRTPAQAGTSQDSRPKNVRLLVAEDVEADAELLGLELRRNGMNVTIRRVETLPGLEAALEEDHDVAVVDYRMPQLGLVEAVDTIRKHDPTLPIILTSGIISEAELAAHLRLGCDDFILKDHLERFPNAVQHLMEKRSNARAMIQAEAERRRTEARYRALFEQASDGVLLIQEDGDVRRIIDANPSAARLLGVGRDNLVGKACCEALPEAICEWAHLRHNGRPGPARSAVPSGTEIQLGSGEDERALEVIVSTIEVEGDEPFEQVILKDVTDHRRLEREREQRTRELQEAVERATAELRTKNAQLQAANEAKRNFLKLMHHEFKTPLAGMLGHLDLLKANLKDQRSLKSLDFIQLCFKRLERLVNDLLSMAELEVSEPNISVRAVRPAELVEAVKENYEAEIASRRVTFESVVDPRVVELIVDRERMLQVLGNLVSNAIKFNKPGGEVRLMVVPDSPDRARIDVVDTGVGIAEEELPRIFDQFYRGSAAQENVIAGTGIGLAVARLLVQRQGGEIHVRSKVGEGTTFTVLVPATCSEG